MPNVYVSYIIYIARNVEKYCLEQLCYEKINHFYLFMCTAISDILS